MTVALEFEVKKFQREVEGRNAFWPRLVLTSKVPLSPDASYGALLAKQALDHLLDHRPDQGRSDYEKAIPLLRQAGETTDLADALANLASTLSDHDLAVELYEEARRLYRTLRVVRSEAIVTRNLAAHLALVGYPNRAKKLYGDAIDLARRVGDQRTEGLALFGLAALDEDESLSAALARHEEALRIFQGLGDLEWQGVSRAWIATVHALRGDAEAASAAYLQAREDLLAAPRTHELAESLLRVARRLRTLHMTPLAREICEDTAAVYIELNDLEQHATALRELGTIHFQSSDLGIARVFYELASLLHRLPEERRIDAIALGGVATMYSRLGQLVMAREIENKALAIHRDLGDLAGQAMNIGSLANFEERLGNLGVAEGLYRQGLDVARQAGDRTQETICIMGLAGVYHQTRRSEESRELHDQALSIATEIGATDLVSAITLAQTIARRDNEVRARSADVRKLLNEWMADDTGYDESTWPKLRKALEENRLSDRKLFHG